MGNQLMCEQPFELTTEHLLSKVDLIVLLGLLSFGNGHGDGCVTSILFLGNCSLVDPE